MCAHGRVWSRRGEREHVQKAATVRGPAGPTKQAQGQPTLAAAQGAQVLAQQRGQHIQPAVNKVHSGASRRCLRVQQAALHAGLGARRPE